MVVICSSSLEWLQILAVLSVSLLLHGVCMPACIHCIRARVNLVSRAGKAECCKVICYRTSERADTAPIALTQNGHLPVLWFSYQLNFQDDRWLTHSSFTGAHLWVQRSCFSLQGINGGVGKSWLKIVILLPSAIIQLGDALVRSIALWWEQVCVVTWLLSPMEPQQQFSSSWSKVLQILHHFEVFCSEILLVW